MFSMAMAIWLPTSCRNTASAATYWCAARVDTPSVPMLAPRATRGTTSSELTPSATFTCSEAHVASAATSPRRSGVCEWKTWPIWVPASGISMPTVKQFDASDDSVVETFRVPRAGSCRQRAVRSNGTTRRTAFAMARNSASRVRLEIIRLLISSRARARSAAFVTVALSVPILA